MKIPFLRFLSRAWPGAVLAALLPFAAGTALGAPGAHGPNGEHLDAPTAMRAGSASPRVEAHSESFELVAELRSDALVILVDRYQTNEPVLGAKLDVESGALKAVAAFRAEQGDYALTDAVLLKALATPGEHPLVFTLVAGEESDLLDATLTTPAEGAAASGAVAVHDGHSHDRALDRGTWIGLGAAALAVLGGLFWWHRRRRETSTLRGSRG